MLTPDYLLHVADDVSELYERLNTSVIQDMARRITRIGVTRTSAYQIERLQESGLLFRDVIRRLSEVTGQSEKELRAAFVRAGAASLRYDDSIYRAAGLEPIPLNQSERMLSVLMAGATKTFGMLSNLAMTTAVSGQAQFIAALDAAYMKVSSGSFAYTQAVATAVRDLADAGISVVNYTGSVDQIDVAVRRAVVTGVNQTMGQLQIMRLDEMGVDLVETTAHYGARPSHRPWQGRVFSRSGRSEVYPEFRSSTGYGTGAGLCGYNCRHSFRPYIEGISEPAYTGDDVDAMNARLLRYEGQTVDQYELSQKQRSMERAIRTTKREMAAFDAARNATTDFTLKAKLGDEFNAAAMTLKKQQAKVADFVRQTGLPRQNEREQVVGFSRSQASKATWAVRKAGS
jgi:hypothetical protein